MLATYRLGSGFRRRHLPGRAIGRYAGPNERCLGA